MPTSSSHLVNNNGKMPMKNHQDEIDTDPEDLEDGDGDVGESEDSAEEDLPLELDDGRSSNKKDEMEVEHLATLERLRQTQRQDYLRVSNTSNYLHFLIFIATILRFSFILFYFYLLLFLFFANRVLFPEAFRLQIA
jgi:hypothetical protein